MLELINEKRSEYMRAESLFEDATEVAAPYPARAPPPAPPALTKFHIYNDPAEFADVDQIAISVIFFFNLLTLMNPKMYLKC